MKLTWASIETPYRAGHFSISGGRSTTARSVLVQLEQDGVVGLGEATPSARVLRQDESAIVHTLHAAAEALTDEQLDPDAPPPASPLRTQPGAAACALDGALLDLWAKRRDEPLWRALGLPRPERPTTSTISIDAPATMAEEARRHLAAGFTHLKVKLGETPERDLARIQAVREAAPRAVLCVDGNEGWDLDAVVALLPAFMECGVEFVEQPLPRDAPHDHLRKVTSVAGDHEVLHILDEAVHTAADAERIAREGLAHGVNLKLQKAGGLRPGLALLDVAADEDLKVLIGCFLETWAGIALALQAAGRATWIDLDGAWLLAEEPVVPVDGPFLQGGVLRASDAPGLGVAPRAGLL